MTKDELISLAKDYLDERGDFWPTASLTRFANQANRIVWNRLAYHDAGSVQSVSRITYPADSESIDLTSASYLNVGVHRVLNVGTLVSDAPVTSSNRLRVLSSLSRGDDGSYAATPNDPLDGVSQQHGPRWKYHNKQLYLVPPPTKATVLRLVYVPSLTTLSSGSTSLLSGTAEKYHDLVVSVMATLMQSKERGAAGSEATRAATALIDAELKIAHMGESDGMQVEYSSPY